MVQLCVTGTNVWTCAAHSGFTTTTRFSGGDCSSSARTVPLSLTCVHRPVSCPLFSSLLRRCYVHGVYSDSVCVWLLRVSWIYGGGSWHLVASHHLHSGGRKMHACGA